MHKAKHLSLFFGFFLAMCTLFWLLLQEHISPLQASFNHTPSVITFTDNANTVWRHTVDALDANADSISIVTTRTQNAFTPNTATQTHSIAFGQQAIGYCTGWMLFENATVTATNTAFSSYLKYCKTGNKSVEIWKTNDVSTAGTSHGATSLVANPTPTPTPTTTPTPLPTSAPYALCSIIRETTTGKLQWKTIPFTYVDNNGVTQNDAVNSGSYTCSGDGGNSAQGGLEGLPAAQTGYITLPAGFSATNGLTCTLSVSTAKGTRSECKGEEKIINLNTVQINGQTNTWHFPVSVSGPNSISLVYGNSSHGIYTLNTAENAVSMQNNIVLVADKKANEILEWTAPISDTGVLKDFVTGVSCTPNAPCNTERVIFYGGTQKGTSSIILSNKTTKQSVSYTIRTIDSAVKTITLSESTSEAKLNTPISFSAQIELFNGETRNASAGEIIWEFSSDGGKTYTTASTDGVISAGKFIAYQEGLFIIRGKIENTMAGLGNDGLKFQKETVYSKNTISLRISKNPPWNVILNGKSASWHFPVAMKGVTQSGIVYGENYSPTSIPSHSATPIATATNTATPTATPTPTTTPTASATSTAAPTATATTTPTATPTASLSPVPMNTLVASANIITLTAYNPSNIVLLWHAPETEKGFLQTETGIKCLQNAPCRGNTVQFVGGTIAGSVPVTLTNSSNNESYSYTVHTMKSATQKIVIENPTEKTWSKKTPVTMKLKRITVHGQEEEIGQQSNVVWEFSYDGGKTYSTSNTDGLFAGGKFIPEKEGSVLIRAKLTENISMPGETSLKSSTKEYISTNIIAMTVEKPPVTISEARIIGGNSIAKNATAPLAITLSSPETLNTLQSFSVALFPGTITESNYNQAFNPAYIFKEIHKNIPLKEFLEAEGNQNRAIFQLPLFIPEYGSMKDGAYTIMLESYRNDLVVSRYFLLVTLGQEMSNFDITNDGVVNISDALLALKFVNGSIVPSESEKKRTDKNGNGKLDVGDVILILKKIV